MVGAASGSAPPALASGPPRYAAPRRLAVSCWDTRCRDDAPGLGEPTVNDMGLLRTTIAIESHTRRGSLVELTETMVDPGSAYTWVPRRVLEQLGIGPERIEQFVTAD